MAKLKELEEKEINILEYLEKFGKKFPKSNFKKSLPEIKMNLYMNGLTSLGEITSILSQFLNEEIMKNSTPDLETQIEMINDYIRLLDISKSRDKGRKKREALKLKKTFEQCHEHSRLIAEWLIKASEFKSLCEKSQEEMEKENYAARRFSIYAQYLPPPCEPE